MNSLVAWLFRQFDIELPATIEEGQEQIRKAMNLFWGDEEEEASGES